MLVPPPPGDGAGSLAHTLSNSEYPVLLAPITICGTVRGVRALRGGTLQNYYSPDYQLRADNGVST